MSYNSINEFKSANDAFAIAINDLKRCGYISKPRGMQILEIDNYMLNITNPLNNIITYKRRNISKKYLAAELLWYMSARQDRHGTDFIVKYAKFWDTLRSPEGSVNSNYGFYIFNPMSSVLWLDGSSEYYRKTSQFEYVRDILLEDEDSRQAVININNITHKDLQSDSTRTKDFPCTLGLQFLIRDGKLKLTVYMRSTDLILGFCNDVFQFTMLQEMMLNELNASDKYSANKLELGDYTLITGSLHIYERHWNILLDNAYHDEFFYGSKRESDQLTYSDLKLSDTISARNWIETGLVDENSSNAFKEIVSMCKG